MISSLIERSTQAASSTRALQKHVSSLRLSVLLPSEPQYLMYTAG